MADCGQRRQLRRLNLSGRLSFVASLADTRQPFATCGFSTDASRRLIAIGSAECPDPTCASSIRVIDLRGGKVTQVGSSADVNYNAALSPDGRSVAYLREIVNVETPEGIWLAAASGRGTPRQLVPSEAQGSYLSPVADPVWAPDGHLIAYLTDSLHEGFSLEIRKLNGGTRKVASGGLITGAVFSPDSQLLAYDQMLRRFRVALRVVNLRTGRIALRSPPSVRIVRGQAWSPDGTKLLVATSCGLDEAGIRSRHWRTFRACG